MSVISYDDKAFIIDGRKVWIASGAIHYFRVPRELWRDRLIKLQRAGLNTVETYIAWNAHEPREGHFDFSDGLDIDAFFSLAEELGLWIIARPGPYICSEWDNGGLPAWLNAKPGIRLRVANPIYHHYIERWFERLIPIIARHQVTRGGRVILVQDENEYIFQNRPGGREHLTFLRDLMRRLGVDVPIVVCNFLRERIADTIECWNCWDGPDKGIEHLRKIQPETPKLVAEFWCGWFGAWGHKPSVVRTARAVHANTLRVLAHGGMYSYYMFHGGTNFGFYPGRTDGDDHTYMVSSYDYDAPLSETGGMGEKYYAAKLASTFATNLGAFFAESEPAELGASSSDGVEIVARRGREGHIIFVFNKGGAKAARLNLPGGVSFEVSFADVDAVALPYKFSPAPGFTIDYSNLSLIGMSPMGAGRLVFLYGPAGRPSVLSAEGRVFKRTIGRSTQVWFGNFPNLVAVMDTARAKASWFLDDRTVVGGAFAGDTDGEKTSVFSRSRETVVVYFPNGRVTYANCGDARKLPRLPRLANWKRASLVPDGRPAGAIRIDDCNGGFRPLEANGYFGGYGWYYTRLERPQAGRETLLFTDAEDRLTVFVNGRRAGVFGRGPGASMGLVTLDLKKGANDLAILFDNLGRANYTEAVGEVKGIRGGVYLGARKLAAKLTWTSPRYNGKLADTWQIDSFWPETKGVAATLSAVFVKKPSEGVTLRVQNVDEPAAIFVNRRFHGYFWGSRELSKLDLTIDASQLADGKNLVEIAFFVAPERTVSRRVSFYAASQSRRVDGPWYFHALDATKAKGPSRKAAARGLPVAWRTTFRLDHPKAPVFFVPQGLKKGEIWLNGRMVSRHWDVGPQLRAYLPEPWLVGDNTLIVVDEFDASPSRARLEYDPLAVTHTEMI